MVFPRFTVVFKDFCNGVRMATGVVKWFNDAKGFGIPNKNPRIKPGVFLLYQR